MGKRAAALGGATLGFALWFTGAAQGATAAILGSIPEAIGLLALGAALAALGTLWRRRRRGE
jgi:hypothetical protein